MKTKSLVLAVLLVAGLSLIIYTIAQKRDNLDDKAQEPGAPVNISAPEIEVTDAATGRKILSANLKGKVDKQSLLRIFLSYDILYFDDYFSHKNRRKTMRLSTRARYGTRALLDIALHGLTRFWNLPPCRIWLSGKKKGTVGSSNV